MIPLVFGFGILGFLWSGYMFVREKFWRDETLLISGGSIVLIIVGAFL